MIRFVNNLYDSEKVNIDLLQRDLLIFQKKFRYTDATWQSQFSLNNPIPTKSELRMFFSCGTKLTFINEAPC